MPKSLHNPHFSSSFPLSSLEIEGHIVTYQDNFEPLSKYLPAGKRKEFQDLLHEAQIYPKKAYAKALLLKKEYDFVPQIDNLVTYLHLQNGKKEEAELAVKTAYEKYPDYFFAKINYADRCLRENNLEEFRSVFPSLDLKSLFPKKNSFHVSEFRGFMLTLSNYHLLMNDRSEARRCFERAKLADPLHPGVLFLEKRFSGKQILSRLFRSIARLISKKRK